MLTDHFAKKVSDTAILSVQPANDKLKSPIFSHFTAHSPSFLPFDSVNSHNHSIMANANQRCGNSSREQAVSFPPQMERRPRPNIELPSGYVAGPYTGDNERAGHHVTTDTALLNASYELYLRSLPVSSYSGETGGSFSGFDDLPEIDDLRVLASWGSDQVVAPPSRYLGVGRAMGGSNLGLAAQSRSMGVGGLQYVPLPPNATSTLFVEGLPANCSHREASHLFRPLIGYKEIRLVNRESRFPGGDPVVLCFVDFHSPAHAAMAMDALQGYIFDEHDRAAGHLRLQFARSPGVTSGGGHHGRP